MPPIVSEPTMSATAMKPTHLSTASEQARIAQLFSHVRDGVIMLDPVGIVSFWSAGAGKMLDVPAAGALGRCYLELLNPSSRAAQVKLIHRALDGETCSTEWRSERRDGTPIWIEGYFQPVEDGMNRRIGCAIILHDVTKWRSAEAARRAVEEQLRTVTDNVPGIVFQMRMNSEGLRSWPFSSRGAMTLLELDSTALKRSDPLEPLVEPEDLATYRKTLEQSREEFTPWDLECRIRTAKNHQQLWIRLRAIPAPQGDGTILWNGVIADVSEKVHAAEALRQSEALYRLLTDNATDIISRISPDGVLLYVSPVVRSIMGYDPAELEGKTISEFLHPDDVAGVQEVFRKTRKNHGILSVSYRFLGRDGEYAWFETSARSVVQPNGSAEIIAVTRGIEERKRLEAKVQNALKMEAVGRLAGGVAHDFNNLLTVINGFSEMILRGIGTMDATKVANQVREIRKAGERASSLTRQLLAFGRQQIQTRSRVNINAVVSDTEKMLGRLIGEDIEMYLDLPNDVGIVNADIGQLEQVLMNLCINARDAMPDGGVLSIGTENVTLDRPPDDELKPGDYVQLTISDTGIGMDEMTRARIFEPFFTTKDVGKGTGLGLAMVYGIIKQSDGHITVESEPDRGTTFRILLPRIDIDSSPLGEAKGRPQTILLGRETCLLVEDDDAVRSVTGAMIRSLGYKVIEAPGGVEAIRMAREYLGPIHLLISDVVMPMMNGREVADRIRTIIPAVKVLFISGYTDDSILRHGVLDEGVAFLHKPLTHETLARKLREVLTPASLSRNEVLIG